MKIYLAGPCDTENRYDMVQIAKIFREYGKHEVYCPWEFKIENAWDMTQEDWAQAVFEADIKAIQECDIFFLKEEDQPLELIGKMDMLML